jgi:drug/metabolite transporter (DMT)-like permease
VKSSGWNWAVLVLLSLIWGSSFVLMKRGLKAFSPDQVAAIRMSVACLASSLIAIRRFKNLEWKYVKYMAVVGMVGSGIPAFLFATAQTRISSYLAGMLNALTPVFTILIGSILFQSRFTTRQLWGVLIGFIGASGLVFIRSQGSIQSDLFFTLLIVLATACYGLSVNTVKHKLSGQDTLLISAIGLIIVGVPYGIYLFQTDFIYVLNNHPQASMALGSLVTLSVFGTALSNLLFFRLVKNAGPLLASAVTYLMPLVALAWGVVEGEPLHPAHIAAMGTILIGVGLINWQGKFYRRKPEAK